MAAPESDTNRKRKSHKKSRGGCYNCKLRRIKCDETKPRCKKCDSFSVACNYDTKSSELELSVDGAFQVDMAPKKPPVPLSVTTLAVLNAEPVRLSALATTKDNPKPYHLTVDDLQALQRFKTRTVVTLGSCDASSLCRTEVLGLAFQHSYLMHVILGMTLVHDRLSTAPHLKRTTKEVYHWYETTSQLSQALSKPFKESEKDALWMTATLLGGMAFSDVQATTPFESWPLKPASPSDLEWLKMSDGKKTVWKMVNPTRVGSRVREIALTHHKDLLNPFVSFEQLQALPPGFLELYDLHPDSSAENNPYYSALAILAQLMQPGMECSRNNVIKYCCFISTITPAYKELLLSKDPRALMVMAWWWCKACSYNQWWFQRRAVIEGQAICIYLEMYHGHEDWIRRSLETPKILCGLGRAPGNPDDKLNFSTFRPALRSNEEEDWSLDNAQRITSATLALYT